MGSNSSSQRIKHSSTVGCFPSSDITDDAYGLKRSASYRESKRGKPGIPESTPRISEITENSLTLSWKCPSDRGLGQIYAYTIESITNKTRNWSVVTSTCQATVYTVKKLDPRLTHSFRVRAENIHGVGKPSLPSHPVCLEHAVKNLYGDITSCFPRSGSLDANARHNVRALFTRSDLLPDNGAFNRQWRSMSLRGGVRPGTDTRLRHTMRQRPRLRGSMYDSPSDDSSDATFRSRGPSQSPEPQSTEDKTSRDIAELTDGTAVETNNHGVDTRFLLRHPIKTASSYKSCFRESRGEIDMGFLNEINNLDLALRQSYHSHTPAMKASRTLPDIHTSPEGGGELSHTGYRTMDRRDSHDDDVFHSSTNRVPLVSSVNSCDTIKFEDFHNTSDRHDSGQLPVDACHTNEVLNDTTQNAQDWMEQIWSEVAKVPGESATLKNSDAAPRIISNTLTCDWESLSDTSMDRALDWRNESEESLTKHLGDDESEIDSNYDFD